MKKLVLFAAVIVAVSFASCGGNKQAAPAAEAAEEAVASLDTANCCGDTTKACCGDSAKACDDTLKACCKADTAKCCAEK